MHSEFDNCNVYVIVKVEGQVEWKDVTLYLPLWKDLGDITEAVIYWCSNNGYNYENWDWQEGYWLC